MRHFLALLTLLTGCFLIGPDGAWAQQGSYTYIRASLQLPWGLYFFFLLLVFIPFVIMIWGAWRGAPDENEGAQAAHGMTTEQGRPAISQTSQDKNPAA